MSHLSLAAGIYANKCTLTRGRSHQIQTQTERHKTQEFGNTCVWRGFAYGTAFISHFPPPQVSNLISVYSDWYIGSVPHKKHHITSEDFEYGSIHEPQF